jgi:hypothetical protein
MDQQVPLHGYCLPIPSDSIGLPESKLGAPHSCCHPNLSSPSRRSELSEIEQHFFRIISSEIFNEYKNSSVVVFTFRFITFRGFCEVELSCSVIPRERVTMCETPLYLNVPGLYVSSRVFLTTGFFIYTEVFGTCFIVLLVCKLSPRLKVQTL